MLPMVQRSSKVRGRPQKESESSTLFRTMTVFFAVLFFSVYAVGVCYFAYFYVDSSPPSPSSSSSSSRPASSSSLSSATPSQPPLKLFPPPSLLSLPKDRDGVSPLPPPHPTSPLSPALKAAGSDWWFSSAIMTQSPSPSNSVIPSPLPDHYTSFISSNAISTQGVIVLGMHRSTTSTLSGLLNLAHGYPVGPSNQLIQPASDNEKGFFELLPVVLQNDDIMRAQVRDYGNVHDYDVRRSLLDTLSSGTGLSADGSPWERASPTAKHPNPVTFRKGSKALDVYRALPVWLQKDPRMCVTLPAWFPFLAVPPAVVFTYRDPLEVALSMHKREPVIFPISRVLELWLFYNRYALQNSKGLCTVYTSSRRIMEDTAGEVERVGEELKNVCQADSKQKLKREIVEDFVDPNLQHNKHGKGGGDGEAVELAEGLRGCSWPKWKSTVQRENEKRREEDLYEKSMQVYCDLDSGFVFKDVFGYNWPL